MIHHEKQDIVSLPIFPDAEKTRLVFMHMPSEDWKRDEAYGSVYLSVEQAQTALISNPQDPKAHRTLARNLVHQMYKDTDYLSWPENSPEFKEAKNRLLMPIAAQYEAALRFDPANPVTQCNLAATYSQLGNWKKAIPLYQQVEAYPPLKETAEIALHRHEGSMNHAQHEHGPH